ncbi:MAG: HU family DNA-binding protein [Bacteroidaceae bacterium]|nr:HU family DNA-binding protein [Bacteroidaceae bacterium]
MNNKEFIADLSSRTKRSSKDTASLVSATVSAIISELTEENAVVVPSFGTFEVKKKLERVLVNPTTKQRMLIPPKMTVIFKPNTSLKSKIKS